MIPEWDSNLGLSDVYENVGLKLFRAIITLQFGRKFPQHTGTDTRLQITSSDTPRCPAEPFHVHACGRSALCQVVREQSILATRAVRVLYDATQPVTGAGGDHGVAKSFSSKETFDRRMSTSGRDTQITHVTGKQITITHYCAKMK
jgi:hypothetical protein